MSVIALIAFKTPIQHYIALTRYQHVGIAVFLFGMGYAMQAIWSWRAYSKWAKISNLATSAFFCAVGLFFYQNTWLESYVADPTPLTYLGRLSLIFVYLCGALLVSMFWLKWAHEDNKLRDAEKAAAKSAAEKLAAGDLEENDLADEKSAAKNDAIALNTAEINEQPGKAETDQIEISPTQANQLEEMES
jgi:hypothetical protein